ncbi:inosine/xanthosine triphosphatase [Alteromonas sp. ASW11-36]|uniref:Inosine/xanthosine triphosphatase n=1 Tax=Alteromonas arenosi TaxID=3055817 RepID=A0ABT7T0V0_9ALTE|nr:inosine/xanthosine triphosphatase [Alteromonas sp. ASW11-36]MDM7862071.1 inosine/xanthosine triphosphatase [Alteromonas sp. ASW11-36]
MSLKVIVGSQNPVKIGAGQRAISQWFDNEHVVAEGMSVPSGVADQPMTEAETRLGAVNRVRKCLQQLALEKRSADWVIAYEGGVDKFIDGPATFAYVAISNGKDMAVGRSANLPLPHAVYADLLKGVELGDVMDKHFNTENIKQKGGAIGLLTKGLATRQSVYVTATIMAMARFL